MCLDIIFISCINHPVHMNFLEQVISFKYNLCIILFIGDNRVIYIMELGTSLIIIVEILKSKHIFLIHWSFFHFYILTVVLKQMVLKSNNVLLVKVHCVFTWSKSVGHFHFRLLFVFLHFSLEIDWINFVMLLFSDMLLIIQWMEIINIFYITFVLLSLLSQFFLYSSRWEARHFWNRIIILFVILLLLVWVWAILVNRISRSLRNHLYLLIKLWKNTQWKWFKI